ncbi:hypothetical protein acsn021_25720 [Anaerocolumna cellulosilytica]|uniref:Uncharacterized protein n=1 Tax=Anaerocolumna cellulosilytica TaxID=433286 RepID=A0A6S6QUQ5_9FIRM|nr:hypothetical protein [Anaerocolumna cellulosilytica]MBB5193780.1 hypothetical protein [Anaerocolumna cellulosilytica]BCJ95003.1 hypothetical protein acsn021_25720 [Anaerocolumna cellulosilytica]
MREIWYAYKNSKYRDVICGAIFAFLGLPFLVWGVTIISEARESYMTLVGPVAGILVCLAFGLGSMFKNRKVTADIY